MVSRDDKNRKFSSDREGVDVVTISPAVTRGVTVPPNFVDGFSGHARFDLPPMT